MNPSPEALPTSNEDECALVKGLVESIVQTRTAIAALQAFETTMLAAAVSLADEQAARRPAESAASDMPLRSIAAEIATALRISDRSVQRQLSDAHALAGRFPATLAALGDGRISRAHVAAITEAGGSIEDDDARAEYEAQVIGRALSETPGRLRPIARMLAERARSRCVDERHAEARSRRRVVVTDLDDGMAELFSVLPAALAHGIHDRLTSMALAIRQSTAESDAAAPADPRSIDELRADVVCDLALSGTPAGHGEGLDAIAATVQITVPVLTLLGSGNAPATLAGQGPIDLDTAKRLTAGAPGWDRVLTHPITGAVLAVDRYRPTEELRRFLRVRDEHCRFPGCRTAARRSDIDHTHDAALGGATREDNLAHLCRRHHVLKHASTWTVKQVGGGVLEWTSPTHRRYVDSPAPTLRFVPGDPPPF
ncbi:hypothetical protein ASD56_05370 [Microbacterium sp. Root166]|uniref:HNH endonuclease signature motif containing protein n=1 Tax=Microbacterium sp. Root166 TaxID=1736478 RepID=UPI0006F28340|nr:HNH endonuclease signature motif containing protein [Microbacterium sp. Root166]KQZ85723.1 hypothetical protein ASD56_05370 [Microbacterium sp. Root166]